MITIAYVYASRCHDGSDELKCEAHTCLESQFKCHNPPKCVPISLRCNGNTDCEDGSDEKECRKCIIIPLVLTSVGQK